MSRAAAPPTASARLRRLRRRLTLIFTAMFVPALAVLAVTIGWADGSSRRQRLDDALRRVSASETRLAYFDRGRIAFDEIEADDLHARCPGFVVVPGSAAPFPAHWSRGACGPLDRPALERRLNREAAEAMRHETEYSQPRTISTPGGTPLRVSMELIWDDDAGAWGGAVIAVARTADLEAAHRRTILLTGLGCAALLALAGLAGHALARPAMRPVVTALEQQETLLADAAHDLRSPLAALRVLAETARADPAQRAELLPRTVRLAERMSGLIDGLLVRARLVAGVERFAPEPLRLDQLVESVLDEYPGKERPDADLRPSVVPGDPDLLRRAVGNLIDNALRHGHAPGEPAQVTVTVAEGQVTVADRGPGIPPDIAETIFTRFHSGSGSTGLGLTIARWIAHTHGGTLSVTTTPEEGTTFLLALPTQSTRRKQHRRRRRRN
ncbi:sensor histidine kinase [Actinomadura decatromicini]|uniref:histidine kinase n=1 Tax=Actinomadura decatromicini TaxID=2604572 RepID=A0A5D3FJ99_9ACTN|nr:HAMP domain-containing sensor histidine kinase [Actinomadura decatromicini]TYK48108.1 HAMP domain-containing histidine kinase [Actinomadura decatromicini]